jgi:YD repeat-containing protein
VTKTESTDWATTFGYDAIGRSVRVDYQDGSFETTTWNPDSTVATRRTRDGLTLTYTYDAANRPLSVVPSGAVAATLEPLDAGDATSWDALSRPTAQRRGDESLPVAYPSYDLGGRPAEEKVDQREALGWAWDIYNQAIETKLPIGVGRSAGAFTGFQRQFNTLNQLTSIGALGGEPQSVQMEPPGAWAAQAACGA